MGKYALTVIFDSGVAENIVNEDREMFDHIVDTFCESPKDAETVIRISDNIAINLAKVSALFIADVSVENAKKSGNGE